MKARIYTKTGDKGETSLVGGSRVSKTHARLEAYGTLDELNSVLGMVRAHAQEHHEHPFHREVETRVHAIQNNLFNIGSHLACEKDELRASLPALNLNVLADLESDMDRWEAELPALREFILPGGTMGAAYTHLARTVCRRAERELLRALVELSASHELVFLNRLSDWCFLLARKFNQAANVQDVTWTK